MPMYEYECGACRRRFEQLVPRSTEADRARCPECGREARRLVSVFSAHASAPKPSQAAGPGCQRCGDPFGPCSSG